MNKHLNKWSWTDKGLTWKGILEVDGVVSTVLFETTDGICHFTLVDGATVRSPDYTNALIRHICGMAMDHAQEVEVQVLSLPRSSLAGTRLALGIAHALNLTLTCEGDRFRLA